MSDNKKNKITLEGFSYDGAAARLPMYVELNRTNEPFIRYGESNNLYSTFQVYYQNVPIHRACLNSKVYGVQGVSLKTEDPEHEQFIAAVNPYEDLYTLYKKLVKDYVVLGSFSLQVIRSNDGGIAHFYHYPVDKVRSGKAGEDDIVREYYLSENWDRYRDPKYKPRRIPAFSIQNTEEPRQLYYYKDYDPNGQFYYAYPQYISAVPTLQLATEVINHHLTSIQGNLTPSMTLTLVGEIPPPETRQEIMDKLKLLYAGTNGQKTFINFVESSEQKPQVDLLTPVTTDGLYNNINSQIQQNIITAHQITSPLLLGIRELGGNGLGNNKDEILISYNHFINTSCKPIQRTILAELERMIFLKTKVKVKLVLEQTTILDVEDIPAEAGIGKDNTVVEMETSVNENIKKLSGREYQGMMRIIREYNKGKLTRQAASQMLKSGYGLSDDDMTIYLGEEEEENTNTI
jgi:hypothetical protein